MVDIQQPLEESESGLKKFSTLSILRTIWKRKIGITVAWIFFAVCGAAIVHQLPSVYQSVAVVLIDSQKIPEKFVSATVASDLEDRIVSIRQQLLSSGELKKVIEDFGLYQKERKSHFEEEILEMMRKDITIAWELDGPAGARSGYRRPGAFRIGYQGSDPALVMRVANRLADLYVEQNLKTREGQAAGTSDFLDTQLRDAKKHLDEMEAAVSAYKLRHNGELPQQETILSGTLARLQTELEANRDAMNRAHQTRVILESSANAIEASLAAQIRNWEQAHSPEEVTTPIAAAGKPGNELAKTSEALELELAHLRSRFADTHPDVVSLRAEIESVKQIEKRKQAAKVAAEANTPASDRSTRSPARTRTTPEPLELTRMRDQLAALKAQIKGSDTELASRETEQQRILRDLSLYQSRIEQLPVREQEMAQITRDYEVSKENYKSLLDKKMAAGMSLDMERRQQSERFIVLDRAQIPERPIKPKRPQLYAAGAVVGLLFALGLCFAAELRRDVFLGEWELPSDTPVLARLPYIEITGEPSQVKPKSRKWFGGRKELVSAALTALILGKAGIAALYLVLDRL